MLSIPCPNCGPRNEAEFNYGGPKRVLPKLDGQSDTQAWHRSLYITPNPRGPLIELWYHASGCECWIEITRNTATHEIILGPKENAT